MSEESRFVNAAFVANLHVFEDQLGVKRNALLDLTREDDWSVVIKCHALLEASVTLLLAHKLDSRLRPIFALIELSKKDTGKLEFAKALDLLNSGHRQFIRELSKLRNLLAHDPAFMSFTFKSHFETIDKNQKRSMLNGLTAVFEGDYRTLMLETTETVPKLTILVSAVHILRHINDVTFAGNDEHQKKLSELTAEYFNDVAAKTAANDTE